MTTTMMRRTWTRTLLVALLATQFVAVAWVRTADAAPAFDYAVIASTSAGSHSPSISADGRFVAFVTREDLTDGLDGNETDDVYVLDRETGGIELVSAVPGGSPGERPSEYPVISADGSRIAFTTSNSLSEWDDNDVADVYLYDRRGRGRPPTVALVSYSGNPDEDLDAYLEDLSGDGNTVVWSTERVVGSVPDVNGVSDVFRTDVEVPADPPAYETALISYDGDSNTTDVGASYDASVNHDGTFFAYLTTEHESLTPDLNPGPDVIGSYGDGNGGFQLTGTTTTDTWRVGRGPIAAGTGDAPAVILSTNEPLTGVDPGGRIHTYRWARTSGGENTFELLTAGVDGAALSRDVDEVALSFDERYLLFSTMAANVVAGVPNDGVHSGIYRLDLTEPQDDRVPVLINQDEDGDVAVGEPGMSVANDGTVAFVNYYDLRHLVPSDTNNRPDGYIATPATVEEDAAITSFNLTTSAGDGEVPVGLDTVRIDQVPVGSIPLNTASLAATPVRSIDLAASPVRSIPVRSIPVRSIPLLNDLSLSALPIVGGWAPRLVGTVYDGAPLHTVTLGQVAALQPDAQGRHPLDGLELQHLDIAASPVRSIGLAAIALGSTPVRSIPVRSIGDDCTFDAQGAVPQGPEAIEANWQDIVACFLAGFQVGSDTTLAALDIAGIPVRSIPIGSIPVRSIDLAAAPVRSIPVRSIELAATPVRSIPLRSILMSTPVRSIPVRSIPVRSIDSPRSGLHAIPVRSIPQGVVDCSKVDCSSTSQQTLGDAADLGAILEGATLELLEVLLDGYSLGDLYEYGDTTIGDLLDVQYPAGEDPFATMTLGDLLVGLLLRGDYPWEELPVADMGLQPVAPTEELVSVTATAVVSGTPTTDDATLTVDLPSGAVYAPGTGAFQRMDSTAMREVPGFVPVEPTVSGRQLTFTLPFNGAGQITTVRFDYHPGVRLQTDQVGATYDVVTDRASASATAYSLEQRDRSDDPATAPLLTDGDTLVVGHLAAADEVDYFRIPASVVAGKRVRIDLAVPGSDQDLVLYSPVDSVPETGTSIESVPVRSIAVEDGASQVAPPETLQDIPVRSIPVRSISANRGDADEAIEILADETTSGHYTIQVSGYNGASSGDPYVLRMRVTDPPFPLECTPRSHPNQVAAPTTQQAQTAPAGTDALFVVNPSRLDAIHGPGAADDVTGALEDLLDVDPSTGDNPLGMNGHILQVDASGAVRDAYDDWDANPCSPAAANDVVTAISRLIEDSHRSAFGAGPDDPVDVDQTIPYVVLVGGDDTLPQARVPDLTRLANERSYLPDVAGDQPLAGAAHAETLLSDDPYGDRDPMPWLNRHLYVPDTALGRLVETPGQIVAQLERYARWNGSLEPTTATGDAQEMTGLVTGYDFLSDGAEAVADALDGNGIDTDGRRMIDGTWSRLDLVEALFGEVGSTAVHAAANVLAINAHFDHYRSLPADQDTAHVEDDLFTVEHVDDAEPDSLARRVLFSMGCHSGLSVPDVYIEGARDWVETFGDQGAAAYAANTGYGYGDTATVALSERLMAGFAENLDGTMSVGQAMQYAKQQYASELGLYGVYDEKIMAEATFYGLPMFRVRGTPVSTSPPDSVLPTPGTPQATGGVLASPFDVQDGDDYELRSKLVNGTRFNEVAGQLPQVTHGRPITPRFDLDVTADDAEARGVLLTGLTSQEPSTQVQATFARPVIDDSAREPAQPADVAFPAYFASVNRHRTPSGAAAKLVLMPGQFLPDDDPATVGLGTQRRFTRMTGFVTYVDTSDAALVGDVTPPSILATSAESNAETATFRATVVEEDTSVRRVLVLYRDTDAGTWLPLELASEAGGNVWEGSIPSGGADEIEYLVQAVDAAGNVGSTTNKGYMHAASTDAEPPVVTVTSPTSGGLYEVGSPLTVEFTCEDENLEFCAAQLDGTWVSSGHVVDTSQSGTHTLVVGAEDRAGNQTLETVTFAIGYAGFTYAEPVASGQRTQVKAGAAVPVRFRIEDANGPVSDRSAIRSITSTKLTGCDGSAVTGEELPATNELTGLHYDATTGEWKYVWKTEKSWKNQCRLLTVTLADGQSFSAQFTLR